MAGLSSSAGPLLRLEGDNMFLANPELFLENERLRASIRADSARHVEQFEMGIHTLPTLPSTFRKFPLLPAELRDAVWIFAAESRVVQFHWNRTPVSNPVLSKTGAPIIMLVCHESRAVGLRLYKKLEWPGTLHDNVILFKDDNLGNFLAKIDHDQRKGFNNAVSKDDHAALQAGKNTIHQQINRNCRRLGIHVKNFESFKQAIRRSPGLYFSHMQHLLVIEEDTKAGKQDKITLKDMADDPWPRSPPQDRDPFVQNGSAQGIFQTMTGHTATREAKLLMTVEEKDNRRRLKEGKVGSADYKAKQEAIRAAEIAKLPKWQQEMITKKVEEKVKADAEARYLEDLALAAKLQLEDEKRERGGRAG